MHALHPIDRSQSLMSDRRIHQVPSSSNTGSMSQQWAASNQYQSASGYPPLASHPAPSSYASPSYRDYSNMGQSAPAHYSLEPAQYAVAVQPGYQGADRQPQYSQVPRADRTSSGHMPPQAAYGGEELQGMSSAQASARMHAQAQVYTHAHSHPVPQPRARSMSHPYAASPSPPQHTSAMPNHSPVQYPAQIGYSQQTGSSQYPASPQRPFSCDMCALSFNRQHDLKRHRDTHSGDKPFLCNGGCGKTFTRKDALKRHQLVKRCGIDDGA